MKEENIQRGFAETGAVKIAFQTSGDGPPLVCCHAMGWDHTLWDDHRDRFSSAHQLITFDQRGSGDSDHPLFIQGDKSSYSAESFGEDLRAVLDALDIEKAAILGYSMGAASALSFSTQWPKRVERLVLVSAMASRLPEAIIQRAKVIEAILEGDGLVKAYDFYFSGPLFEGESDKPKFKKQIKSVVEKATSHGFQGCFRVTIDRPSMIDALKNIQAPTLVIVGERDKHYMTEADLLVAHISGAKKFVVKNSGHALTVQSPDIFESEVLTFLAG